MKEPGKIIFLKAMVFSTMILEYIMKDILKMLNYRDMDC